MTFQLAGDFGEDDVIDICTVTIGDRSRTANTTLAQAVWAPNLKVTTSGDAKWTVAGDQESEDNLSGVFGVVSATLVPAPGDDGAGYFADLFAAPSAYKGGYVAGRLAWDAAGVVSSPYGLDWTSLDPQATAVYGEGFSRLLAAKGAWYSKTELLTTHYATLRFEAPDATDRVPPAAAQAHWGDLTVSVDATGKKFVVDQKKSTPVQDKVSKAWSYEGANDAALEFSFTQATGIWKGSFLWWFDEPKHASQKVPFEGIMVQGEDLEGFGTYDVPASYVPVDKTGKPQREKTYKVKESVPVSFDRE